VTRPHLCKQGSTMWDFAKSRYHEITILLMTDAVVAMIGKASGLAFSCAEPASWNSLPPAVIICDTLSVFKSTSLVPCCL